MIKLCTTAEEISQIYDILNSKKRVAGRNVKEFKPKNEFIEKFLTNLVTYAYFEKGKIVSYLSSKLLKELPAWHVFLVGTDNYQQKFNISDTKISEVVDATLDHWESRDIFSVVFLQARFHRSHINGENISKLSDRMKNYTNPAATLEIIKKGEKSKFTLINDTLCQGIVFPKDMVVKWSFKKDCFKDYE